MSNVGMLKKIEVGMLKKIEVCMLKKIEVCMLKKIEVCLRVLKASDYVCVCVVYESIFVSHFLPPLYISTSLPLYLAL